MDTPQDLTIRLENAMSSPAASDLRGNIVKGLKKSAIRAMVEEGLSAEEAEFLYKHLRSKWVTAAMSFVELPLKDASAIVTAEAAAARAASEDRPSYLVRFGPKLVQSTAHFESGDVEFYVSEQGFVPLKGIHQIWRIERNPA